MKRENCSAAMIQSRLPNPRVEDVPGANAWSAAMRAGTAQMSGATIHPFSGAGRLRAFRSMR
jgi:hypothetical protein